MTPRTITGLFKNLFNLFYWATETKMAIHINE